MRTLVSAILVACAPMPLPARGHGPAHQEIFGRAAVRPRQPPRAGVAEARGASPGRDFVVGIARGGGAGIVLMGLSRGGEGALVASLRRFREMFFSSGAEFVVYVPFYGDCSTAYLSDT